MEVGNAKAAEPPRSNTRAASGRSVLGCLKIKKRCRVGRLLRPSERHRRTDDAQKTWLSIRGGGILPLMDKVEMCVNLSWLPHDLTVGFLTLILSMSQAACAQASAGATSFLSSEEPGMKIGASPLQLRIAWHTLREKRERQTDKTAGRRAREV